MKLWNEGVREVRYSRVDGGEEFAAGDQQRGALASEGTLIAAEQRAWSTTMLIFDATL